MSILSIDPAVENASTLQPSFYTSQESFELSKEKIFCKTWQFCLDADELVKPGSITPFVMLPGMLDEPLMFVRDLDEKLHCMSNVCTHRGSILVQKSCQAQKIRCPYHGRRFHLNGEFIHMPGFECTKNFPTSQDNLPKVEHAQLGKFTFASLSPSTSFNDVFNDIKKRLFWMPFDKMRLSHKHAKNYQVKAHWALYCENYLEGLHIPFVHPALRKVLDFSNYTYELNRYSNLQLAVAGENEACFDLPASSQDYGKRIAAYYYWIFPNTMLNFYPWGCSVNVVKPVGPSLTNISFLPFVMDESMFGKGAGGDLDTVEMEDEAVVELMQKGVRSRLFKPGRYSASMEIAAHHFHRLICEFMNE